ncbi:glycosyl hydrolase family 18 [Colletotrichum orchidophilum]|uniref:chitinase n=1 Tax=Colletotrichum orchidophilum TaxID=1209926 RepID=A0A1G4BRQ9_9PEZI|nr:glycosyl hydrolase family 18 [Colletotrichum orchidophilum]OHF04139.1 glycosyl hydrolase family 18 [Colletotrichum orchidophilum]
MSFAQLSLAALLAVGASASPCSATNVNTSGVVASAYFAGYHANRGFPVSKIPWEKYTDVKYAFAETAADGSLNLTKSAPDQLPAFVAAAKQHNVKALASVGGWSGSRYFSTAFGSPENRTAFVKTCLDLVEKYNLDGLDFDVEYPARQGLGCNTINDNDTANFASFLTELRQKQKKQLYLTAATSLTPWNNAQLVASTNGTLAPFANTLDYLMIMGYDIYGPWAATGGPNAPLAMACDARNTQGGIQEGVAKWIAAGIPANKLVLAVAAYGHGFSVNATSAFTSAGVLNAYPPQNSTHRFQGGSWDNDPAIDECGAASPPSGTYTFWSMIKEGKFLDEEGKPLKGIATGYDKCSQTPYLYNETAQVWVSYDDVESLTAKGKFVTSNKLAGFAIWEAGGDYNNILVNAIRSAVGL